MTQEQQQLAEQNMALVPYRLNVFNIRPEFLRDRSIDRDDLRQIGFVGLCKAAKSYNPSLGYAFATYASRCIDNAIFMLLRSQKSNARCANVGAGMLDEPVPNAEGLTFADMTPSNVDVENEALFKSAFDGFSARITQRERDILTLSAQGGNQRQIAKAVNLSQGYTSRTIKRLRDRFRDLEGGFL